jgi:Uma2 family endonuclease
MTTIPAQRRRRSSSPKSPRADSPMDRLSFRIPTSALTLAGFRAWATSDDFPQHIRAAFINGEIFIEMSNEEMETHVAVKTEVSRVLSTLVRELKLGKFYVDGVLISNEGASLSNNPDACFFRHESIQSGRIRLIPRQGEQGQYVEAEGAPDWVLEVVSQSSVTKDTEQLRRAYHRTGIPEYWLIDARGADITFQVLNHRKNGYAATPARHGWLRSQVFDRAFRLERQHDVSGLWEYTLHVQPINS